MRIEFSSKFIKSYKKLVSKRPDAAISVLQKVLLFSQQPTSPSLALHKSKGAFKDVWSFSVETDLRIIIDKQYPIKTIFVDVGSHDEVY